MKSLRTCCLAILAMALFAPISMAQTASEKRPSKEKMEMVTVRGTVTDINKETRAVTLVGSEGNYATITASDQVKRFDEIAVGDVIELSYYTYFKAEFRNPTPAEFAEPLVVLAEADRAPEGMPPGAVIGAIVTAVVTVEIVNRPAMSVTVMGPRANYLTIPVMDTQLIQQLNVGEVVILTYAEAMAISLKKIMSVGSGK